MANLKNDISYRIPVKFEELHD